MLLRRTPHTETFQTAEVMHVIGALKLLRNTNGDFRQAHLALDHFTTIVDIARQGSRADRIHIRHNTSFAGVSSNEGPI
jgi:hypothetical protein